MGKIDRIAKAGVWPRVLGAEMAALYCGVSHSTFLQRVENGIYPKPFQNGALVQWDRIDLDAAIDALKENRKTDGEPGRPPPPTGGNEWDVVLK